MMAKKYLILPVISSFLVHAVMLALAGYMPLQSKAEQEKVMAVELKNIAKQKASRLEKKTKKVTAASATSVPVAVRGDEAIDLGNTDVKYYPYLKVVREKIDRVSRYRVYPRSSHDKLQEGTSSVKFTIDGGGNLTDLKIVSTSGHQALDQETLHVIRAAAPYGAFPPELDKSALTIIATFHYRITD